ncbi:unnamed protein product [Ambrosiozyma monospora]|uniref:Ribonuclease H2 subunit B n=1 Tax=Ambrosiozyma monospora TaxID=43982 RepID=A0A9W6YU73_AMBMO|nr:unnamed protein product [Ambrosiozyma monospora]
MTADTEILKNIDKDSLRVAFFPNTKSSSSSFKTIKLTHPITKKSTDFLIPENTDNSKQKILYEINNINFRDSFNEKQRFTKDNKPLKSLLFTPADKNPDQPGLIIGQTTEIYVATEYNIIYSLLQFFRDNLRKERQRIVTYDDLVEQFEESELLTSLIPLGFDCKKQLTHICELIEENNEVFYKPSLLKILSYLRSRVDKIVNHFPQSLDVKISKKLIVPLVASSASSIEELKATDEIIKLNKIRAAVNLLSSYVDNWYLEKLLDGYDFAPIDEFLKQIHELEEKRKAAEESINNLNEAMHSGGGDKNSKKRKAPPPSRSKKQAVKVEKGKGALDMFFKKPKK